MENISDKMMFVLIGSVLALGCLILVALGSITFTTFLSSIGGIYGVVYGVYQWYVSKDVKQENTKLKSKNKILEAQLNENKKVQKKV